MKKIILTVSMILVIILQIAVLTHFFIDRYSVILNGDKFRFLITDVELENARETGYIEVKLKKTASGKGEYGIIHIDDEGFAELSCIAIEKPKFGAYVKSSTEGIFTFPIDRYYINTNLRYWSTGTLTENDKPYIVVRDNDGLLEIVDCMVGDYKIEKYIPLKNEN